MQNRHSGDGFGGGRSVALVLAALAATGWGFAFYASYGAIERERVAQDMISSGENKLDEARRMEAEAHARLAEVERRAEQERADIAAIRAERRAEQAALAATREELAAVEARLEETREALSGAQDRRSDLEASLAALQTDIDRMGGERATRVATTSPGPGLENGSPAALNAALARLDRSIDERSNALRRIEASHTRAEERFSALAQELEHAETALSLRQGEAVQAQERLSGLLDDIARLDALIERRDSRAGTLARTVEDLTATIAERQSELVRLEQAIAAAEAARAAHTAQPAPDRSSAGVTRDDGARVIRVVPSGR